MHSRSVAGLIFRGFSRFRLIRKKHTPSLTQDYCGIAALLVALIACGCVFGTARVKISKPELTVQTQVFFDNETSFEAYLVEASDRYERAFFDILNEPEDNNTAHEWRHIYSSDSRIFQATFPSSFTELYYPVSIFPALDKDVGERTLFIRISKESTIFRIRIGQKKTRVHEVRATPESLNPADYQGMRSAYLNAPWKKAKRVIVDELSRSQNKEVLKLRLNLSSMKNRELTRATGQEKNRGARPNKLGG